MARSAVEKAPKVPEALSDQKRVEMIAQQLLTLQAQEFELGIVQEANDREDGDTLDGPVAEGQEPVTYGQRRKTLSEAQKRIAKKFADYMPMVSAYIEGIRQGESS